jgi:hypothetical protein
MEPQGTEKCDGVWACVYYFIRNNEDWEIKEHCYLKAPLAPHPHGRRIVCMDDVHISITAYFVL